jgi:hypothetical protein
MRSNNFTITIFVTQCLTNAVEQSPFSEGEPRLICQESGAEHYYEPVESIPHSCLGLIVILPCL